MRTISTNPPGVVAFEDLGRCVDWRLGLSASQSNDIRITREIERALRRGSNAQRIEYNGGKVEAHELQTRRILDTLNAPSMKTPTRLDATPTLRMGPPLPPCSRAVRLHPQVPVDLLRRPNPLHFIDLKVPACIRLVKRAFAPGELPSLIETTFSSNCSRVAWSTVSLGTTRRSSST